jgi:hypothetical protein
MGGREVVNRRALATAISVSLLLSAISPASAPAAPPDDLPHARNGVRPGPAILYADPPRAPQLENLAPWRAKPILVSGVRLSQR